MLAVSDISLLDKFPKINISNIDFIENEGNADARWMQQRYEDGFMKWMKIALHILKKHSLM